MFVLPRSWRRSIRAFLATGCLLVGSASVGAFDIPVTNTNDSGPGSLRLAINTANALGGSNNIVFAPGVAGTITLANALPPITSNLNINGPGAGSLTINGNNNDRIFFVESGAVAINGMTLSNGLAQGGGGGGAGGGGGLGAGGAVFVGQNANVTIQGVRFGGNAAVGGNGGSAGTSSLVMGGGGGGGLGRNGGSGGTASLNVIGPGADGGDRANNGANSSAGGGAGGGGAGGNGGNANGSFAGGGGGGSGILANSGASGGGGAGGPTGANGSNGGNRQGGGGGGSGTISTLGGNNGGSGGPNGGGGGGGVGIPGGSGGGGGFGGGGGGGAGAGSPGHPAGNGGNGGFGAGGGAGAFDAILSTAPGTPGAAGFGGGNGGIAGLVGGSGGSALGGALFVQQGGSLTIVDGDVAPGNAVTAGSAGSGGQISGQAGQADGAGIFLNGVNLNYQSNSINVIADQVSGTGGLNLTGPGTLILSANNNDYAGPTNVLSGTLLVNGLISSPVFVSSLGTLGGNGTVGATQINGGTIAPGFAPGLIGTLTVNGNFTQNQGVYQAKIDPSGANDQIKVNGSAQINGGTIAVQPAAGAYLNGEHFTILTATGGVNGTYSGITGNVLPGYLTLQTLYDPNDIQLVVHSNFASAALTFNEKSVANYLDTLTPTPGTDLAGVLTGLNSLSPAQLDSALNQIGGSQYQSLLTVGRLRSLYEHQLLADQIRSGIGNATLGPALARGQAPDCGCQQDCNDNPCLDAAKGLRAWSRAYGLGGAVAGDGNADGFNYTFYGFQAGFDSLVGNATHLGLVAGYNHSNVDFQNNQGIANADGLLAGLYGSHTYGELYALGAATYAYNGFTVNRPLVFDGVNRIATGNLNQNEFNGLVETGLNHQFGAWRITPLAGLQYLHLMQTNVTETGANSLNLAMAGQNTDALWASAGLRAARPFYSDSWVLTPILHARYITDFIGEERLISGSLSGAGGSFAVAGAAAGRDYLVAGISMAAETGTWFRFIIDYTCQTSGAQTSHTGSGGVQVQW